jgi:branched-chain amino acid transport system permease protein
MADTQEGRRGFGTRRLVEAAILAALLLLPLGSGRLFSDFYIALCLRIMIFGVLMLGFDLLAGYCGLVSFGHAMFFGTGAYVAAVTWKYFSDSMWIGMLLGLGLNAVIGYVLGLLVVRTRTVYFIFLTFAFSQFFFVTANSWRLIGGTDGLTGIPAPTLLPGISLGERIPFYYFTVALLVAAYLVARRIVNSHFGRLLRGIHQNEERVKFLGYNSPLMIRRVFLISGLFGSVSGTLMACFQPFVPPDYYHLSMSGEFVMMGLLGGMGTLVGPLAGTAIVIFLGDFLSSWLKEAWMLCLGAMYVICILFSPEGLTKIVSNLSATGLLARLFGRKGPQGQGS